ncbi:conserved membrane hypothetical protein [Frankia canadensis]|uniref:Exosortase/archaeosortase family protein n=1 Tax=Frankia canadensis TaxID=1836972 RepID=A0A2I2KU95_9ACTN|nr:hypothetical protein [Frankia canadensis]SNQ49235.1 conserved membrane hypothetical protein [Frankia canadensis]SOU56525.1 conserved membrane hypothetical protein [Frankia canadensis]
MPSARSGVPPACGPDTDTAATPIPAAGRATNPAGAPAGVRVEAQAPREPGDARIAAPGSGPRAAIRWRVLTRGLWVAAAAAAALAGGLPRLWDAALAQGPAAYRLAAVLAGALALLARARRRPGEPSIHDRQIDYLVGLPLLLLAAGELTVPPARYGDRFWAAHADLIALPLLAAGAITVVFGTRALWRARVPLAAWAAVLVPWPQSVLHPLSDGLAWPALAVARAAATLPGGWQVVASPPGDTIIRVTGSPAGDVALGGATRGLAGGLTVAVLVVLTAATATGWREAPRRALASGAVCALAIVGRLLVAVLAGAVAGPSGARVVLGHTGDLVTLTLLLAAVAGPGLAAGPGRTRGVARRPATGRVAAARPAVPRARVALALVAVVCAGLAALDVAGNRQVTRPPEQEAGRHPGPAGTVGAR